jgi:hypothetical protein
MTGPDSCDLTSDVLRLLLSLAGTDDTDQPPVLGHQLQVPVAILDTNVCHNNILLIYCKSENYDDILIWQICYEK